MRAAALRTRLTIRPLHSPTCGFPQCTQCTAARLPLSESLYAPGHTSLFASDIASASIRSRTLYAFAPPIRVAAWVIPRRHTCCLGPSRAVNAHVMQLPGPVRRRFIPMDKGGVSSISWQDFIGDVGLAVGCGLAPSPAKTSLNPLLKTHDQFMGFSDLFLVVLDLRQDRFLHVERG